MLPVRGKLAMGSQAVDPTSVQRHSGEAVSGLEWRLRMDTRRSVRPLSRRHFLGTLGALSGAALVAACGQQSTPAPSKPAETKPAETKPAEAAKPAAPAAAPAATAAPAAAAPAPDLKVTAGVFNVWFSANWNEITDKAVGGAFEQWGQKNGGIKV